MTQENTAQKISQKVYVLTTDLVLTKQNWMDWEERWSYDIPICIVSTEIVGVISYPNGLIYAYEVKWWEKGEFDGKGTEIKVNAGNVFFDKDSAVAARDKVWEAKKKNIESMVNKIYSI
jgi:hypothetical protein